MLVELVGRQSLNFKDSQSGRPIIGVKLFFTCKDQYVNGLRADSIFIREESMLHPKAETIPFGPIELEYGFKGRLADIRPVNTK